MKKIILLIYVTLAFEAQAQKVLSMRDSSETMCRIGAYVKPCLNYGTYVGGDLSWSDRFMNGSVSVIYSEFKKDNSPTFGYEIGADIIVLLAKNLSLKFSPAYQSFSYSTTGSGYHTTSIYTLHSTDSTYVETTFNFETKYLQFPLSFQYYFDNKPDESFYLDLGLSLNVALSDTIEGEHIQYNLPSSTTTSFLIVGIGYVEAIGKSTDWFFEPMIGNQIATNTMVRYLSCGIKLGIIF